MSLEDPFFVVKDEVLKALHNTRELYERWRAVDEGRDIRSIEEQEWAATELRNALRSIEWDLEDLDDTVQIVEKNPAKFRIDAAELAVRKGFITSTRDEVAHMKGRTEGGKHASAAAAAGSTEEVHMDSVNLGSPTSTSHLVGPASGLASASNTSAGLGTGGGASKYSRLPNESDSPGHGGGNGTFGRAMQQQQQLVRDQNEQLGVMTDSVGNLRNVSRQIGSELDEQAVMLDEFGTEIENAETKLDATMRKMAKVLHMSNDRRQWAAIGLLSSAVFVVILLIFAL